MESEAHRFDQRKIAYFSMEIGLESDMKTYAGGLGILAGDTLKAAADLEVPVVGISLLYRNGYFKQILENQSVQIEQPDCWNVDQYLEKLPTEFTLEIEKRQVVVPIWRYTITGATGYQVPVYFLDTRHADNSLEDSMICEYLYTRDAATRLKQFILLGIGGVKALELLGYSMFDTYHLNECDAAFALLALEERLGERAQVKEKVVFTTHTPIAAGHKKIAFSDIQLQLAPHYTFLLKQKDIIQDQWHMTQYCLNNSRFANAVAKKHGDVTRAMFPNFAIDSITNGVHPATWTTEATKKAYTSCHINWQQEPYHLKHFCETGIEHIPALTKNNKANLITYIHQTTGVLFDPSVFTIGFGRRVVEYKRQDFILQDVDRIELIAKKWGGLQLVFSGKEYPEKSVLHSSINRILERIKQGIEGVSIVYLPDYSMDVSLLMVAGSDIWLNNPQRPLEASGTSGMKASMNGTPNFSILDGWWLEGWKEGVTGWSIGTEDSNQAYELMDLYNKLDTIILPMYFQNRSEWEYIQAQAMSQHSYAFSAHRMVSEYAQKAYKLTS
jgi:glycogen phosphorylase